MLQSKWIVIVFQRFLNDGDERFLRRAPRLKKSRKVTAATQLRYSDVDRTGARFPQPIAVAVAAIAAVIGSLTVFGAAALLDLKSISR